MLINEMEQAQYRLDVAMFYLSNKAIIDTLCRLSATHGVRVRFITDKSMDTPANRPILERLDKYGVAVFIVSMPKQGKMHLKSAVVDVKTVLTGAANWSEAADQSNYEDMLVLHSVPLALKYSRRFGELESQAAPFGVSAKKTKPLRTSTRRIPVTPRRYGTTAEAATAQVYFTPGREFMDQMNEQLIRAQRVDIGMYLLTDDQMLKTLQGMVGKVRIRVVVDSLMVSGAGLAALQSLWDHNVEVYSFHRDRASMHLKSVVIDDRYVWTGSANWTDGALTLNAEDMICLDSPTLASLYRRKLDEIIAVSRSFEEHAIGRRPATILPTPEISSVTLPITGPRTNFTNLSRTPFAAIEGWGHVAYLPDEQYQPVLRRLIQTARQSIFILMYIMPEQKLEAPSRNEVLADLKAAAQRGVYVYMVLFNPESTDDRIADDHSNWAETLRAAGIDVRLSVPGAYMHMKAVIVDLAKVLIGSHNWSEGALSGKRVYESSALVLLDQQEPKLADLVFSRPVISDMSSRQHWEAEATLIRHLLRAKPAEREIILERSGVEL